MSKKHKVLLGIGATLIAVSFSFSAAAETDYCPASYYDASLASCKLATQRIYSSDTSDCGKYAFGGAAVGAGGLGGAAILLASSNPWGLAALGIGAIGSGLGVWGSSSCYNDAAVMRDLNLASCDSQIANLKAACAAKHQSIPIGTSSASAAGGDSARPTSSTTGPAAGNNSGTTTYSNYNAPAQPGKKGKVYIW